MRKIAVSLAALLLASPACAQAWYPGFTGTYTGGGGGGGSYVGPADVATANGLTPTECWSLRACTASAANAGANAIQLIGDGTTVATTVSTIVTLNANGSLNLTAAYASGGACAGGDGTCFVNILYGQIGGKTATAAAKNATYAVRFYQNCPTAATGTNGSSSLPCMYAAPGATPQYLTTLTSQAQPLVYSSVTQRLQSTAPAYTTGDIMSPTGNGAPNYQYGGSGALAFNSGATTTISGNTTEGRFNALLAQFNGAGANSTTSGILVNGGTAFASTSASNTGTTGLSTALYLFSSNGSNPLYSYSTEFMVLSGAAPPATLALINKNQSTYWGLGF